MTTAIDISLLSLESGDVEFVEVAPESAINTELVNPVFSENFEKLNLVYDVLETIFARKFVCREDVLRLEALVPTCPHIAKLLDRYPANSFSEEPSRINYDVSTESFVKSAFQAVVKALKDVLKWFLEIMSSFWDWLTTSGQQTAAVDSIDAKLRAIQSYLIECGNIFGSGTHALGDEYIKVKEGAVSGQFHNLNKKWNQFRQWHMGNPNDCYRDMETLSGVITTKLAVFVEAVDTYLSKLRNAVTEGDISTAVAKIELFDINSGELLRLAINRGYNPRNKLEANVTPFQAMTGVIKGKYRGMINDRTDIHRGDFEASLTTYAVSEWSKDIEDVINTAKKRIDPTLKKINEFNPDDISPRLDDIFVNMVTPSFKALTSILSGFTNLQQSVGLLTANRNNVSVGIAKAALETAKKIDAFVVANKSKLTIAEQNVLWRQRGALKAVFGD